MKEKLKVLIYQYELEIKHIKEYISEISNDRAQNTNETVLRLKDRVHVLTRLVDALKIIVED